MSAPIDPKAEPQVAAADAGPKLAETETKLATNPVEGEEKKEAAPVSIPSLYVEMTAIVY